MPRFRVTYADGRTEDVRTLLGDSIEIERRGKDVSVNPLEAGSMTVWVALQRRGTADGHAVDWKNFDAWANEVEGLEALDGADPTPPAPSPTGSAPPP